MKLGPEDQLQRSVVQLLRLALPAPCLTWAVPNGGNLSPAQRALFLMTGRLAGVHDLAVIWPRAQPGAAFPGGYGTLELKAGKNTMDDGQEKFARAMEGCGHPWEEIRTAERALAVVGAWVAPMKLRRVVVF